MLFLVRILIIAAVLGAVVYSGLYALGALVEPEAREITMPVPLPKSIVPAIGP